MKLGRKSFKLDNIFLEKWPFPKGASTTLHWIKSPEMIGEEKQWMMDVVFKQPNGVFKDVQVPWGMLPMLRLGKEFVDGFETGNNEIGDTFNISFSKNTSLKVEEAFSAVSKNRYELRTKNNLHELCVIMFDGVQTVVIPCLEIIRFFFALNKMLALKTLQPFDFSELVAADIKDQEVFLEFTKQIPKYLLNPMLVKLFARLFADENWFESWQQIYIEREKQITNIHLKSENPISLKCIPPVYKNSIWQVRAIQDGKRLFVLEILRCVDKNPSIIQKVEYIHPRSYIREKTKYFPGSEYSVDYSVKLRVNRTSSGPKTTKNPLTIENLTPGYIEEDPIEIKEISHKSKIEGYSFVGIGINPKKSKLGKNKDITVSFNDDSKLGNSIAAEFIPTQDDVDVPKGLKDFFKAINIMKRLNPNLEISHSINTTPEYSGLAYCGLGVRKYALVKVTNMGPEVYIIEFDLSDGHSISTILFSPADLKFVERLFNEFIVGQGNWAKEDLEEKIIKEEQYKVNWVKHTSKEPHSWGERILQKAVDVCCSNLQ
jgi:hypothetical protein